MPVIAHIGNIPVEESLPFLAPIFAVYFYGRHTDRRRREQVKRLPDVGKPLDEGTVRGVLHRWAAADHKELSAEHLPLLYPPGPEGMTASQLASRIRRDSANVRRLLEDLEELGYLELEDQRDIDERRALLTGEGYDLVNLTEEELLKASRRGALRQHEAR